MEDVSKDPFKLIKMKVLTLCAFMLMVSISAADEKCTAADCQIAKNCRCSDGANPLGANIAEYPQVNRNKNIIQ